MVGCRVFVNGYLHIFRQTKQNVKVTLRNEVACRVFGLEADFILSSSFTTVLAECDWDSDSFRSFSLLQCTYVTLQPT